MNIKFEFDSMVEMPLTIKAVCTDAGCPATHEEPAEAPEIERRAFGCDHKGCEIDITSHLPLDALRDISDHAQDEWFDFATGGE